MKQASAAKTAFLSAPVSSEGEQWDITRPLKMPLKQHFQDMANGPKTPRLTDFFWEGGVV